MRLPQISLTLDEQLSEFDVWITPSTGEIRDTEKFQTELNRVTQVFEILRIATKDFEDESACNPDRISHTFIQKLAGTQEEEQFELLRALASVLYLVTGKSDNNSKCQFPIYLRDVAGWTQFPTVRSTKGKYHVSNVATPRELKADKVMTLVQKLSFTQPEQERLLHEFVQFILRESEDVAQLWSIGRSYCMLASLGRSHQMLTPLVVFQVRGSVSASGGHDPENILRDRMREWGMEPTSDFNSTDVIISVEGTGKRQKTRAYDFTLPYCVSGWEKRLFVQCQFYAGDSGSVSHKNVDQTTTSRAKVMELFGDPVFVEYVDGAGYFSSLNGDLRTILSMENTTSFFQIKTAAVRLRRELQHIDYLTPLELEHALLVSDQDLAGARQFLNNEGYEDSEINRVIENSNSRGFINAQGVITAERRTIARRYFLLDIAARMGSPLGLAAKPTGSLLVPGYGAFYGIKLDRLADEAIAMAPCLSKDWTRSQILADITWLCDEGLTMSC